MIYVLLILSAFILVVIVFIVVPIKIIKNKKINWLVKSILLSELIGLWIYLEDYDFFVNIAGPELLLKHMIEKDFGIPLSLFLIIFCGLFGLVIGLIVELFIKIINKFYK